MIKLIKVVVQEKGISILLYLRNLLSKSFCGTGCQRRKIRRILLWKTVQIPSRFHSRVVELLKITEETSIVIIEMLKFHSKKISLASLIWH